MAKEMIGLILTSGVGLILVIASLMLISGRGSNLIAGYNTLESNQKSKYDMKALSKFIGKIIMPTGVFLPLIAISGIYGIAWIAIGYGIMVIILAVFAIIYCNTGKRFRI